MASERALNVREAPTEPQDLVRQIANVVALAGVLVMNVLANALPLFGRSTGEISDGFAVLFVPAGYVFSIWGLIYLGLIGFAIFQALPRERTNPRLRRLGFAFVLSCAANVGWLLAWHALLLPLSMLLMLILLVSLIVSYLRLGVGRDEVSRTEKVLVHAPFSLYLGWITVATVANASVVLYDLGWDGWGLSDTTWAVVMLAVATFIGGLILLTRRDVVFNLVLVWAFVGIFVSQQGVLPVAAAALAAAGVVLALIFVRALRAPPSRPLPQS